MFTEGLNTLVIFTKWTKECHRALFIKVENLSSVEQSAAARHARRDSEDEGGIVYLK